MVTLHRPPLRLERGDEGEVSKSHPSILSHQPLCLLTAEQTRLSPLSDSVSERFNEWLRAKDASASQPSTINPQLGKRSGMLGVIFRKAQNKIQDPAKLRRLIVDLIDKEQWSSLSADVKGDAYEGLLQKNAEDVKGGAGQYFTPRSLIAAIVDVVAPQPGQAICDPACGTGGFLLAAHDYLAKHHALDRAQKKKLKSGTFFGIELVDSVTRLCAMNLLLHGIGGELDEDLPVVTKDALAGKHGEYDIVLANPPFGKKSSVTIVNEAGETSKESLVINRDDFWATTSNKQLNFLQHIFTILKQHGRAAVVLPDNVLFEGGAGETIRRELLKQADVHTLLRLPTGIFYAQGVKANVLFFDRKPAQEKPWTRKLWIYDLRTNLHFTLKENTLKRSDLDHFVACYNPKNRHERKESERFKSFPYEELMKREKVNLDIFWLKYVGTEIRIESRTDDWLTKLAEIEEARQSLRRFPITSAAAASARVRAFGT